MKTYTESNHLKVLGYNKFIAEFMGGKYDKLHDCTIFKINESPIKGETWIAINRLEYHSSWDWLMPVVGKIQNMDDPPKETQGWYAYYGMEPFLSMANIEKVYHYVIEFIEWYNNNMV